jgi:hypothetical protein
VNKMKVSDRVQVKAVASVNLVHRGRIGTVIADTVSGKPVEVEFDDETVPYSFNAEDLEGVKPRDASLDQPF